MTDLSSSEGSGGKLNLVNPVPRRRMAQPFVFLVPPNIYHCPLASQADLAEAEKMFCQPLPLVGNWKP